MEALDVRCQNRISNLRLFLDSLEYICMVRHLHKGANRVECSIFTNTTNFLHHISQHKCFSLKTGPQKIRVKMHMWDWQVQSFLCASVDQEKRIKYSALYSSEKRRLLTCGTHFEETKLVASITGRPAPESMSISWILTPVGTIS